jgi:hypothetical protein
VQGWATFEDAREGSVPGLNPSFWYFFGLWQRNTSIHMFSQCDLCPNFLFFFLNKDTSYWIRSPPPLVWPYLNICNNFISK